MMMVNSSIENFGAMVRPLCVHRRFLVEKRTSLEAIAENEEERASRIDQTAFATTRERAQKNASTKIVIEGDLLLQKLGMRIGCAVCEHRRSGERLFVTDDPRGQRALFVNDHRRSSERLFVTDDPHG